MAAGQSLAGGLGDRLELAASAARLTLPVEALGSAYEQALPELLS